MTTDFGFVIGEDYQNPLWKYTVLEIRDNYLTVKTEHGDIKKLSAERSRQIIDEMTHPAKPPRKTSKPVTEVKSTIPTIKLPEHMFVNVDKPKIVFTDNERMQKKYSPVGDSRLIENIEDNRPDLDAIREYLRKEEIATLSNKESNRDNLKKYKIYSLYFMSYFKAAPSIMTLGIFCRQLAVKFKVMMNDFSDQNVQARRKKVHGFVPLYFTTYNAMKFRWLYGSTEETPSCMQSDELVFFEINAYKASSIPSIQFTNMNAAKSNVHFFSDFSDLEKIIIKPESSSVTAVKNTDRQAEVLIPQHLPSGMIQRVIVYSSSRKVWLEKEYELELKRLNYTNTLMKKIPITVSTKYF